MAIDAGTLTLIQTTFLQHLNSAFVVVGYYALRLLYLFAILELVIFGLVWAMQREASWGRLIFKVLKIGLIFFIIQNFAWILNSIITSFAKLAGIVVSNQKLAAFIFNPAQIWQFGYDAGLQLLQQAATGEALGLVLIKIILGVGILLVFGLLGIQLILQIVAFYLVAFTALIFMPFGTFTASGAMFDKSIQAVLQAGIRLMVLIIVIGIGATIWDTILLTKASSEVANINQPLGLFFTALLFLYFAVQLPTIVSDAVGEISGSMLDFGPGPSVEVVREAAGATAVGSSADVQAATAIESQGVGAPAGGMQGGGLATATQVATPASGTILGARGEEVSGEGSLALGKASVINKSISEGTIKKIKEAVSQAIQEK